MAAKVFEVGDVLPATTQLAIYSNTSFSDSDWSTTDVIATTSNYLYIEWFDESPGTAYLNVNGVPIFGGRAYRFPLSDNPIIINTSDWTESQRTVTTVTLPGNDKLNNLVWEDLNAPSGYTISFNSNGGTTISDIEEATELPTPLPTPTKSGYKFVAWYYESNFQTRAKAGDTIEANTTLYAKWHNLGTLFTGIANAIRSKDGTSGNIRDLDFDDRIRAIEGAKEEETKTVTPNFSSGNVVVTPTSGKVLSQVTINKDANFIAENLKKDVTAFGLIGTSYIAIELTQAQYDALGTKDANTYYLING